MAPESAVKVVHEAEAQRQHVRLNLPLVAEIGPARFKVTDWSVGGFAIEGLPESPRIGSAAQVRLLFPFDGFEFALKCRAEVRHASKARGRVGFRFVDLPRQHVALLQYFVDAYVTGEIVRGNDVLEVAQRNMFVAPRKVPAKTAPETRFARLWSGARAAAATALLVLFGLTVATYTGFALYERIFVVAASGFVVSPEMQVLRAGLSGTVIAYSASKGRAVRSGELIGMIQAPDGKALPVEATCDCFLASEPLAAGSYVARGSVVARLVPSTGTAAVVAHLPLEKLHGLNAGDRASLDLFTGVPPQWGTITSVERYAPADLEAANAAERSYGVVRVRPDRPLALQSVGEPVALQLHRLNMATRS